MKVICINFQKGTKRQVDVLQSINPSTNWMQSLFEPGAGEVSLISSWRKAACQPGTFTLDYYLREK